MSHKENNFQTRTIAFVIIALLIIPSTALLLGHNKQTTEVNPVIGQYLRNKMDMNSVDCDYPISIRFEKGTTASLMEHIIKLNVPSISIRHSFDIISVTSAYANQNEITRLSEIPDVLSIMYDKEYRLEDSNQEIGTFALASNNEYIHPDSLMHVPDIWDQGFNGTGVTVAVLDSGCDPNHPDLIGRISHFHDLINEETTAYDDNGHGTAVSWLVAGSGQVSGGQYTGMAPGADLMIVKVLDEDGAGEDSLIAQGIEYAADNGADVIVLSLGGAWTDLGLLQEPSSEATEEVVAQGVNVVIAAGNSGPATSSINSPGITEEAITVGASIRDTGIVDFSSRGPVTRSQTEPIGNYPKPDLIAPGYQLISARASDASWEFPPYNTTQFGNDYTIWSGTSASAPLVAGLAAILLEKDSDLSPIQVKAFLMAGSTDIGFDPMAQGFGLANISKSVELLDQKSGEITIISPISYPTLPGSSQVLIVGEEKQTLNATIISTESLGSHEIIVEGNASKFINIRPATVTVSQGYSYFEIMTEVPEGLPLSDIGKYFGELKIISSSEAVTSSMDLEVQLTSFGGELLVDMAHHSADDPDSPESYKYFDEYLKQKGVLMEEFGNPSDFVPQRIDQNDLATSDIFMIMDTETSYNAEEIEALHQFVEDGGTLIMLSEYYDSVEQTASFALDSYNDILEPYGITVDRYGIGEGVDQFSGLFYGLGYGGAVENHSLVEGVENLYIVTGGTLSVDPSVAGAQGLFWVDSAKTQAIVATVESGHGKVIVISDGSTLYDNTIYDALEGGADNLRLLRNLAQEIIPKRPRVFDLALESNSVGEPANITAYVFDEDLESVTFTLMDAEGNNVTGDFQSSLGYVYRYSFIMERAGFYNVKVVATDSEGNVRIISKTILIPVRPIDDQVVMTVIYSLLAIVGIGLAYIGIRRYLRKPKSPEKEEEWTPLWEDDSQPPAIE
ncbi:MAG: S8 family serine peptidase [Candidatus Lokiarchaeota archaeon]|nr:S8 family serine peptidase [Candidatus Lokiarchaeota archaeon]